MIGNKIKYTCKNCGWCTSIVAEWTDIKPKRCMNKKCNTSFIKTPDALIIEVPEAPKAEAMEKKATKKSKKSETEDVKS